MREFLQNGFSRLCETILPQQIKFTQEEKREIIDDLNGSDSGKKINSRIKLISYAIDVLKYAVVGASFQYYKDYHEEEAIANPKNFVNQNSDIVIGLSICVTIGLALELAKKLAIDQVNSNPHITSQNIKNKISALTPKQLTEAITGIAEGDENALNIKLTKGLPPLVRKSIKCALGIAAIYTPSLTEDQQLLAFTASIAIAGFAMDQLEKKIYRGSRMDSAMQEIDNIMPMVIAAFSPPLREHASQINKAQSILGTKLEAEISETEREELSKSIKLQMEKALEQQKFTKDVGEFFFNFAKTAAFLTPIILNPGEKLVEDRHFASALNFAIGSISSNLIEFIGKDPLISCDNKVAPVQQEESVDDLELNILKDDSEIPATNPKTNQNNSSELLKSGKISPTIQH